MKQCPRCNRTYADDTLSYCLEDGAVLIRGRDPEDTLINPLPHSSNPPPTVAYTAAPPAPAPMPAPVPAPRQRSPLAVIAMVLAALVVGLSIGGFIFRRYSSPSSDEASASPTPRAVVVAAATPTPASATPTPAQMATPSPSIVQSTPEPASNCVLYNDKADKSVVRVRMNCDTQDCDNDSGTIAGEYPDNTPVRVVKGSSVRGAQFTWMKVVITGSERTVWVASSKIKCS